MVAANPFTATALRITPFFKVHGRNGALLKA